MPALMGRLLWAGYYGPAIVGLLLWAEYFGPAIIKHVASILLLKATLRRFPTLQFATKCSHVALQAYIY